LAVPAVGSSKKSSPEFSLLNALDVEKPVVCPEELRNARGVQLRNLRLEGAHSISSSSGIEACRRECPCWPTTVLEMHGMVCES
jgi:hypothetical protein